MSEGDSEQSFTDPSTCDYVNEEPLSFKGLTSFELKVTFLLLLLLSLPFGFFISWVTGIEAAFLFIALLFPLVTISFTAGRVESYRRGKPPGYLYQRMYILWKEKTSKRFKFVYKTYHWGLGRDSKK
ncbi:DUF3487 family protein [Vibrio rotiferianus]|uniref:DUF3487 family protein n=1 Tax=Vibrio rotiferianus TaxID=190895 RepID=UPI000694660E